MIFAGQLTETLEFYHIVETQSESGYKSASEVKYNTIKAYRAKNKETYVVDANELFHQSYLTFKFRIFNGVEETDIVIYEGKKYRITSIDKYPRDREMTIIVERVNE